MLLANTYELEKVINLRFSYSDGTVSQTKLHVGDVATIQYNHAGTLDEITGKISRIEAGTHYESSKHGHLCQPGLVDSCDKNYWYIIVDASLYNDAAMKKIEVKKIIGCEVLKRNESVTAVTSPLGNTNITDIRLVGDIFEISMNNGKSWIQVARVPKTTIMVDPELQPVVDKIADSIPANIDPATKEKMIMDILKSMEEEGQIIINKNQCSCGCGDKKDPDEEDKPTEVPSTPMQPQFNIHAIAAAVVEMLKEEGLVMKKPETEGEDGGSMEKTPGIGDSGTTTE